MSIIDTNRWKSAERRTGRERLITRRRIETRFAGLSRRAYCKVVNIFFKEWGYFLTDRIDYWISSSSAIDKTKFFALPDGAIMP